MQKILGLIVLVIQGAILGMQQEPDYDSFYRALVRGNEQEALTVLAKTPEAIATQTFRTFTKRFQREPALVYAAQYGMPTLIQKLIEAKASVNIKANDSYHAENSLERAINAQHFKVVEILVKNGACIQKKNESEMKRELTKQLADRSRLLAKVARAAGQTTDENLVMNAIDRLEKNEVVVALSKLSVSRKQADKESIDV